MPIELQKLDELDQATVDQSFHYLARRLKEAFPQIDTRRGVLGDLVLQSDAILDGLGRAAWDRLRRSTSLLAIADDPTLVVDDVVDRVFANWGVERGEALPARGEVTIVLNRPVALTIAAGEVFVAQGQRYAADTSYAVRTSSQNVAGNTDRYLQQVDDDRWAFTIAVTALTPGTAGIVPKDASFVPVAPNAAFVRAYASSDFTGGVDAKTTAQMLSALRLGIASRAYSNRVTVEAMIRNADDAWQNIIGTSVIGAGDAEMLRDRRGLVPVVMPGRTDVYARTQHQPVVAVLQRMATLISTADGNGVWQVALTSSDAPGFYDVPYVEQLSGIAAAMRYGIIEDHRAYDLDSHEYVPDIQTSQDAAYSPYQTAVIQFVDPDTPTIGLTAGSSQREYGIAVRSMPYIAEMQAFIGHRDISNPNGDNLVRAAVPCFTSINLHVAGVDASYVDTIRNAILGYVNSLAFVPTLYSSQISAAVHAAVGHDFKLSAIDMSGRIRGTDGQMVYVRGRDTIEIPQRPEHGITPRTTCFICTVDSVGITVI